jgi:hypothetical protein
VLDRLETVGYARRERDLLRRSRGVNERHAAWLRARGFAPR